MTPTLARLISPTAWRGYNASDKDEWIRADYLRRYGVLPVEIVRRGGYATVLVGPVVDKTHTGTTAHETTILE